jgi:hypothetical protein
MAKTDMQKLTAEMHAALGDIDAFNTAAWCGLIGALEEKGILSGQSFARWLNSAAQEYEELKPNHRLGKNRLDTAMLRGIAEMLEKPMTGRWEPLVIQGGKGDNLESP